MGIAPFAEVAKMPRSSSAKMTLPARVSLPIGTNAKMPNEPEARSMSGTQAEMITQSLSELDRLRRLEEAKAFLRQHLSAGPQPARTLLKAARVAGIATRTLHRAKDALGVKPERSGGYGAHGQWTWYPPEVGGAAAGPAVPLHGLSGERG